MSCVTGTQSGEVTAFAIRHDSGGHIEPWGGCFSDRRTNKIQICTVDGRKGKNNVSREEFWLKGPEALPEQRFSYVRGPVT